MMRSLPPESQVRQPSAVLSPGGMNTRELYMSIGLGMQGCSYATGCMQNAHN